MKFGLDIHGIIDTKPRFYSNFSKRLVELGHEVHVITGAHVTYQLKKQLMQWGIEYTHLFSIADFHKHIGTSIRYDVWGNPWIDTDKWNRTKGDYCQQHNIDLHIDDSPEYGKYFNSTIYLQIK